MIGLLRGTLAGRDGDEVLVEVAGVGYRVTVTPALSAGLGELGGEVVLHIHHHIREDAQTLYGFQGVEERRTFGALLAARGVGPALAQSLLSVHSPASLATILANDDLDALCLVNGVGVKSAARLLVELKSRLDIGDLASVVSADEPSAGASEPHSQVRQALAELGYRPEEVGDAMAALPDEGDSSALLKAALQHLGARS